MQEKCNESIFLYLTVSLNIPWFKQMRTYIWTGSILYFQYLVNRQLYVRFDRNYFDCISYNGVHNHMQWGRRILILWGLFFYIILKVHNVMATICKTSLLDSSHMSCFSKLTCSFRLTWRKVIDYWRILHNVKQRESRMIFHLNIVVPHEKPP